MKTKLFISRDKKEFSANEKAKPDFIQLERFPVMYVHGKPFKGFLGKDIRKKTREEMRETMEKIMEADYKYDTAKKRHYTEWHGNTIIIKTGNHYRIEEDKP